MELPKALLPLVIVAGAGVAVASCIPIPTPTPTPTLTPSPTQTASQTPSPTPIPLPVVLTTTIDYAYDPLYRLTAADYDSGEYFHYGYDPVGNRMNQETHNASNTYSYNAANRLMEVDGVSHTWDAKGNLIEDGERTYTYDYAIRLIPDNGLLIH